MIPEQTILEGFLSYKKRQVINYPDVKVCLVNGMTDSDPNLSNGSGKSGLFESIPVNFFGKAAGRGNVLDQYINDDLDSMNNEQIFIIDGQRYKITFSKTRGSSSIQQVFYDRNNNGLEKADWKLTDSKVEDILGLSLKTYSSTLYLNERDSLKFIDGESADRKDILRELLNIKNFEQAAKKCNNEANEIERKVETNRVIIESKKSQFVDEDEIAEEVEKCEKDNKFITEQISVINKELDKLHQEEKDLEIKKEKQKDLLTKIEEKEEELEELNNNIEKKETKLSDLKEQYEETTDKIETNEERIETSKEEKEKSQFVIKKTEKELKDKEDLEEKLRDVKGKLEKTNSELKEKEKDRAKIRTEISQLEDLLQRIEKFGSVCPVTEEKCPIVNDSYKQKFDNEKQEAIKKFKIKRKKLTEIIEKFEESLEQYDKKQDECLEQIEVRNSLQNILINNKTKLKDIESKQENYKFSNSEYEKTLKKFEVEGKTLKEELETTKKKIEKEKEQYKNLKSKVKVDIEEKLESCQTEIFEKKKGLKDREEQKSENSSKIAVVKEKLKQNEEIQKHIKKLMNLNEKYLKRKKIFLTLTMIFGKEGIQKTIMKQTVPYLENSSSELLKIFNNDSEKIKIKFDLDPKRADGEFKKGGGLDILVLEEGKKPKDLRMYSGGERVRIVFSIALGLAKLLSKRSGKKQETLIIDEKIAKLDKKGIEQFAEVINIISDWYKRIFIITHIEAIKDMFDDGEILINKTDDNGSIVEVK